MNGRWRHTGPFLVDIGLLDDDLQVFKSGGVEESFGCGREGIGPIGPNLARGIRDAVDVCWRRSGLDNGFVDGWAVFGLDLFQSVVCGVEGDGRIVGCHCWSFLCGGQMWKGEKERGKETGVE